MLTPQYRVRSVTVQWSYLSFRELGQLGVQLGSDQNCACELRVGLHHDVARGGVLPVRCVLHAKDYIVLKYEYCI